MPHPSTEEEARTETELFGPSAVTEYLEQVVEQLRDVRGGEPSSSIPALAQADTERFGVVIATADGSYAHRDGLVLHIGHEAWTVEQARALHDRIGEALALLDR